LKAKDKQKYDELQKKIKKVFMDLMMHGLSDKLRSDQYAQYEMLAN